MVRRSAIALTVLLGLALWAVTPAGAGGPPQPAAPTDLQASVVFDALLIDLHWQDNATDEDSYLVERSTAGPGGPWTLIVNDLPANTEQYSDGGLTDGVTYWYRVAAATGTARSTFSNVVSGTAVGLPTPPPPAGDANCDFTVNSLDAAIILQLVAALTGSLPCEDRADANQDGSITAVDATLVLQVDAGLIGAL